MRCWRGREASRREAAAAAERLDVVGALFVLRCRESGDRAEWATDTWEAVAAQVAAALRTSVAMGSSYLRYAMAMRNRLPKVGQAFRAGDIDYRAFQTIVFRTDLITDAEVLAKVDAQLAALLARCPAVTRGRLSVAVDQVVADVDRDAVRRAAEAADGRFVDVDVIADGSGLAALTGSVLATAGEPLTGASTSLRTRCAPPTRAPVSSAAPTRWGRWWRAVIGWRAAASAAALPRRGQLEQRGDSRRCRSIDCRRNRSHARCVARRRRADPGLIDRRAGQGRHTAAADATVRAPRVRIRAIGGARRLRAVS